MSRSKIEASIEVRESGIHGRGVYAIKKIKKGSEIIEYTGERIGEEEANERYEDNPSTYLFMVDDDIYIDGLSKGNEARFINHSCDPNCVAYLEDDNRVVIYALKKIRPGDELAYNYRLTDEGLEGGTDYTCYCGAEDCKGTMMGKKKKKKKK